MSSSSDDKEHISRQTSQELKTIDENVAKHKKEVFDLLIHNVIAVKYNF